MRNIGMIIGLLGLIGAGSPTWAVETVPYKSKEHRVLILGGFGPTNSATIQQDSKLKTSINKGLVFGGGYERHIIGPMSLGGMAISNGTFLGVVGLEFE